MRLTGIYLAVCGLLFAAWQAFAQLPMTHAGLGTPAVASYSGPGDVIASWGLWGSCARVYNLAAASTSTSLCDLVATGNGTSICTLRGTTSGLVDLAASYCNSTTPSAACAAANGGSCSVSKIYDGSGNSRHLTQATLADMPVLSFNVSNGLPCTTWANVGAATLGFSTSISQNQPFTFSTVVSHTQTGVAHLIYNYNTSGGNAFFGTSANTLQVNAGGSNASITVSDATLHALQIVYDDSNSLDAVYVDGTNNAISGIGTNGMGGGGGVFMSSNGSGSFGFDGKICELGYNPVSMNATQKSNVNSNQHGTNGYNF